MSNTKICTVLALAALSSAGCSSDRSAQPAYAEPSSESMGDESTESASQPSRGDMDTTAEAQPLTGSDTASGMGTTDPGTPKAHPMPGEGASEAPLTDPQITKVTDAVNAGEIAQAKLAQTKAKNASVKQFAKKMVTQHTKAQKEGAKLAASKEMDSAECPLADQLKQKSDQTLESLQAAERAEFDQKYIDAQVQQHQEVLSLLDDKLIPHAQSPELKTKLQETRSMVDQHLTSAKEIQEKLSSAQ